MVTENLDRVLASIEDAKRRRADKNIIGDVELIAVTKNHPVELMREAVDAGIVNIGENRVQEAQLKKDALARTATWHLLGHLQTNKAKQAVRIFDLIHSLDSVRLAEAIDKEAGKIGKRQQVLVQVNLAREAQKTGVYIEDLPQLLTTIANSSNLCMKGFMCIAPNYSNIEECRPLFRDMYRLFLSYRDGGIALPNADISCLSMGMSHDYHIAIEEGANIVRVGTAIFGARQYQ